MSAASTIPRAGLIGVSGYGRVYLQLALDCQRRGELQLVAAVVINPQEEATTVAELRGLGCEVFADYEAMLEKHRGALELCLIPTGIAWHTRMTVAALAAGANVLVEKPLACSLEEVRTVETAAAKAGRFVAVGFQDFYEPATWWLKEQLMAGVIGEIRSVRFLGQWPRGRSYFTRNNWAGRVAVDGVPVLDSPLSNAFAHFVNLSLYFASPRANDAAAAQVESVELFRAHEIENFDTAVVRLRTEDGVALWLGATHACRETREPEIIVTGASGSVVWRHENDVRIAVVGGAARHHKVADQYAARRAMMTAVLRRLADPAVAICGPGVAARHTAIVEQIARTGKILTVPEHLIGWNSVDGPAAAVPVVAGLEAALGRAYANGTTLAQAGFQVTRPSSAVSEGRVAR
jgi:predicted dehydrogenase